MCDLKDLETIYEVDYSASFSIILKIVFITKSMSLKQLLKSSPRKNKFGRCLSLRLMFFLNVNVSMVAI